MYSLKNLQIRQIRKKMSGPITCPSAYDPSRLTPQSDMAPSDYTSAAQLYSAMRMFGSPTAVKLAMAQSEQTPLGVSRDASSGGQKLHAVNYTRLDSVLTGRTDRDLSKGDIRDNSYSVFQDPRNRYQPPIRAEHFLGTKSSRTEYGEIPNTRIEANNSYQQPRMLNLMPTSANAECREKEVIRLNKLNDAYVAARMASAL